MRSRFSATIRRIFESSRGLKRSFFVLSGMFIVNQGDAPVTYRAGDVFNVSAGGSHTEEIGAQGARVVVDGSIR
jgi:EutQ-like cupin domain